MTWRTRFLTGFGVVLATLALLVSTVSAASVSNTDPRGDGTGAGDLRGQRLNQTANVLRLRIRTEIPLNQANSPAWHRAGTLTRLRFEIDTRGSTPGPDYAIVLTPAADEIAVTFRSLVETQPRDGCIPGLLAQDDLHFMEVAIGSECFQGLYVRSSVRFRFDQGGDGDVNSIDRAPNTGYGPKLVLER